ncbi:ankyrin repeat domain-containing protein [Bradyrhizobium tropiciagri]|uniref:ankyrin repeat domain-containing protein n=1 Tax=Bradyrhizobium tropiciagri TaxID=312253 RepID=UPI000B168AE9|nr:ankyrin repeat domain-containing protein [Bradyrhizobium tropiciagri]
MMPEIVRRLETAALPAEEVSGPFWNACRGGQLATAKYLLERGADLNWPAPWSGQTPLDIAEQAEHREVAAWLLERGATRAKKGSGPDAS